MGDPIPTPEPEPGLPLPDDPPIPNLEPGPVPLPPLKKGPPVKCQMGSVVVRFMVSAKTTFSPSPCFFLCVRLRVTQSAIQCSPPLHEQRKMLQ